MDNSPETAPQTPTKIEIALHERRRHGVITGAIGGAATAALLGAVFLSRCGGGVTTETRANVRRAEVFSVTPTDIDMRALQKAKIEVGVSKSIKTPVDHWHGLGMVVRAFERTNASSSTFTGKDGKGGGEVDTLIGASARGVFVSQSPDGKQVVHIPTSSVVEFSAVNLGNSLVVRNDGNMAALGQFEWSVARGIAKSAGRKVAKGRAALDMMAQAEAVNVAQVQCAEAAWPLAKKVIQEGYRLVAQETYEAESRLPHRRGERLKPFNPVDLTVEFIGPKPDFKPAYPLPHNVIINGEDHGKINCSVDTGVSTSVASLTDISGSAISTSVNDYISHEPLVYANPPARKV